MQRRRLHVSRGLSAGELVRGSFFIGSVTRLAAALLILLACSTPVYAQDDWLQTSIRHAVVFASLDDAPSQAFAQPRDGLQTAINASVVAFVGLQALDTNLTTWILAKVDEICPDLDCYQEANRLLRPLAKHPVGLVLAKYAFTAGAALLVLHVGDRDAPQRNRVIALVTGIGLSVLGGVVTYKNYQHYQRIRGER